MRVILVGILGSSLIVPAALAQPAPGGAAVQQEQVISAMQQQLLGAETLENYWYNQAQQLAAQNRSLQEELAKKGKMDEPRGFTLPTPPPGATTVPAPAGGVPPGHTPAPHPPVAPPTGVSAPPTVPPKK